MPVLTNMKHELVAQGLAEGKDQKDAWIAAGYKTKYPDRSSTECLKKHPEIKARAAELREAIDARKQHALDMAAEQSGTSKAYVLQRLHELVERCMQHYPVIDKDGEQVYVETPSGALAPAYTFDAKGAARGLHLLGLEHGMFAQRFKIERSPFEGLPAPILQQIYGFLAQSRGRVIEHDKFLGLSAPGVGASAAPGVDRQPPA